MKELIDKINPAILITFIIAIIGDRGVINFLNRPDLRCRSLPPYESSTEAISGIIVENRGQKTSKDIVVRISVEPYILDDIKVVGFVAHPELEDGGINASFVVYTITRLSPNVSGTIFLKTTTPIEPEVICEDETGLARLADSSPKTNIIARTLEILGIAWIIYRPTKWGMDKLAKALRKRQQDTGG